MDQLREKVLYIDAFNIFFSAYYFRKDSDAETADPIGGFIGLIDQTQRLAYQFRPQRIVLVFDGPDAGKRRRALFPDYKGKHPSKERFTDVIYFDEKIASINNQTDQLRRAYDFLKHTPITTLIVPYYEADDVIAYLVKKNQDKYNVICSSDKDYLQLVNEYTHVWSPQKRILYDPLKLVEHWEVSPGNLIYYRSIIGDSSDKLVGVKGIGKKTLLEKLPQIKESNVYEDFWQFWAEVEKIDDGKILSEKFKAAKEQAHLMYRLMKLDEESLNQRAIEVLQAQLEEQNRKTFSKIQLKLYCIKEKLNNFIKNYDIWVRPFMSINSTIEIKS
jgi:DNA polymerase-1